MTAHAAPALPDSDTVEALMTELSVALGDEFDALRARDVARLEATVMRKSEIVAAIESAAQSIERAGGPGAAGYDVGAWPALQALAQQCMVANRANGGAIELNRRLVSNLLDTLYGVSRVDDTYDAGGHLDQSEAARSVGQA